MTKVIKKNNRIEMIDALRGFALAGILLLHHIQHFNFRAKPDFTPDWLMPFDTWLTSSITFFIGGKAFALFSLLFGLSYWIIFDNANKRGESYFFRHFWRMTLLAGFGLLHLLIFAGDILLMYAVLALPLVFTRYMSNRIILALAIVLLLNPVNIYALGHFILSGDIFNHQLAFPNGWVKPLLIGDSFWQLAQGHYQLGYQVALVWSWNVGRVVTILGLFFLGVYFAKNKSLTTSSLKFWYTLLLISLAAWFVLVLFDEAVIKQIGGGTPQQLLAIISDRYIKIVMMLSILASFVIVWQHNNGDVLVAKLIDFGRMGLTNYLLMSVIGASLYYGWGLALYKYCGVTASLLIGLTVLALQIKFSSMWLARHGQGPCEKLWRQLTWLSIKAKPSPTIKAQQSNLL